MTRYALFLSGFSLLLLLLLLVVVLLLLLLISCLAKLKVCETILKGGRLGLKWRHSNKQTNKLQKELYSKEPKSVTSFCELAFFHADISQSEFEDSFQLASEWIRSVRKTMNNSKAVTLSDSLL